MQTKSLFSQHYLQNRLPDHAEWHEEPGPVFEAVRELWRRAQQQGDSWNESQTEQEFIQPVLELLGWTYTVQPQAHHAGRVRRPDYALFLDQAAKDGAMPHQGDDTAFYAQVPTIAEAKYWGRPLSQKDSGGQEAWDAQTNPSHQMVSYLVGTGVPWGILTNGRIWRLYSREVSSTASEFYEIDLTPIFDPDSPSAIQHSPFSIPHSPFKRWWLFFRRDSFVPDAQGRCFVERVHEGSTTYARRISDKLKELVYEEVMPEIAGGFVAYRRHQMGVTAESAESLRQIYRASLSLLYKLLFLLYGEARSLLPVDNPGYREQSLTHMAQWAAERIDRNLPLSDATHATARYETLLALFHRIDQGDPSLGIPRYDGGLFDPSSPENQFLEQHKLSDRAVARAVDILVRDAGEPVDYAYIGVQNLGSIYEGLLENRLRLAESSAAEPSSADGASGAVELVGDKGERKATGSYYTPDYIVEYIVQQTLDPILEDRDGAFRAAMDRCAELRRQLQDVGDATTARRLRGELEEAERDAREAFLGIKTLDPAMGSGHFLVNAVDHLTDAIIRRMQVYHDEHPDVGWDWNPIQRMIEYTRGAILAEMEEQGIRVDAARLDDTALLTRLVMKRCIYGVDLNRMAVELAKVSLWLHTFTVGAPLSFLDHHLRWGNSLIGADVRTVEREMQATDVGQMSLWQGPFAGLLDLTGLMVEVVERADATLSDVQQSADDFKQFQDELTPYKRVLDLWVSQHFGNEDAYEFLTLYGEDVLPALKGEQEVPEEYEATIERAHGLYQEKRFFHWDLEFPEVFIDLRARDWAENPGFDAVIGNPPYVNIVRLIEKDVSFYQMQFETFKNKCDLYSLFLEKGLNAVRESGYLGFVVSNTWLSTDSFSLTRGLLLSDNYTKSLAFPPSDAFPEAIVETVIVVTVRRKWEGDDSIIVERYNSDFSGFVEVDSFPCQAVSERAEETASLAYPSEYFQVYTSIESSSQPLEAIASFSLGIKTSNDAEFVHPEKRHLVDVPVIRGRHIDRYAIRFEGEYLHYDVDLLRSRYGARPREREAFDRSEKIVLQEIGGGSLVCAIDKDSLFCLDTVNMIFLPEKSEYRLSSLAALLNSCLLNFWYGTQYPGSHVKLNEIEQIPIRRIAFTTPADERERLAAVGITEATEWIERTEKRLALSSSKCSVTSVDFSAFSDSSLGHWLDARLSADPEQSDVVHDLLAHLAERMIELHKERQRLERALDPFKYLDRGAPFVPFTEAFAEEIKYGQRITAPVDLGAVHHDIDGLRLVSAGEDWELQVQLKKRDPEEAWKVWQYEENGNYIARQWVGVYRFSLDEERARYYQQALAVLDEFAAAKSFPGGYTRSTAKKLQLTRVPAFDAEADLVPLVELSEELARVRASIGATDRLIDLIVYRLYGLTAAEVAVVEAPP